MNNKEIYNIWAPVGVKWGDWVRPVPFITINDNLISNDFLNFTIPKINYIDSISNNTAIIVDLSGYASIQEGIALAQYGYRPIPLYNGTAEQENSIATTDNHTIKIGLIYGTLELKNLELLHNAPPAFLLDSNRMNRFKMNPSVFDNSWDIFYHDVPSAEYLLKNGITNIIVRTDLLRKDLKKILYKYQQKGINIFFTNGYQQPQKVTLKKSVNRYIN